MTEIQNTMAGWSFDEIDIKDAMSGKILLNPSIDLSNPCNLNCPYCFVEEKESKRKIRFDDELSLEETINVIQDFAQAGAKTVNIVGAGEPTIDPHFKAIISEIDRLSMIPVLFTNGIRLARSFQLLEFLYETNTTVVMKYNSTTPLTQDLVAGRKGYSILRDKAINGLLDLGFNAYNPTRLAFDVIAYKGVLQEIEDIFRWCRTINAFPIIADYIPTGRTEEGVFSGVASLAMMGDKDSNAVKDILNPLTDKEKKELYTALSKIDEAEFCVERKNIHSAYYSGAACTQLLGLYVDIHGNIWPCVARAYQTQGGLVYQPLGSVRNGDLPSLIWRSNQRMGEVRAIYNGTCIYKSQLTAL